MNDRPKTRQEQLLAEQNPDVNPLIPHGSAARQVIAQMEREDTSHAGELHKEMDILQNPLIPGHSEIFPSDKPWFG